MKSTLLAAAFVVSLGSLGLAGCGGSSGGSDSGPAAKFLGLWALDTLNTTFVVSCTKVDAPVNFWNELDFERGILTDVSETSSTCLPPGLALDVEASGVKLSAPHPDPYTGAAPLCSISLGPDGYGLPAYLNLTVTNMEFTLLPETKGKAPTGLLSVAATGSILQDDGTGTGNYVEADTCTYSGSNDTYHRMTQE